MQNIEYGDINKFLVSIGLILISLSIISPYLYLTQNFGINIDKSQFEQLQEPVQEIILDKQDKIKLLQSLFYIIPGVFFIIGSIFISIGLSRWSKRQRKIDEKFDKEVAKLTIEIEALTQEEREEKVKEEIRQIQNVEYHINHEKPKEVTNKLFRKYIAVEEAITEIFKNYNSRNFEVLAQQKLGNKFEVDIFLKSHSSEFADRIIEIKYFQNEISSSVVKSVLEQLNTNVKYYKSFTHKPIVPVLLIVYHLDKIGRIGLLETEARILSQRMEFSNLRRLKTEFIEENEIDKFKVQRILKR